MFVLLQIWCAFIKKMGIKYKLFIYIINDVNYLLYVTLYNLWPHFFWNTQFILESIWTVLILEGNT